MSRKSILEELLGDLLTVFAEITEMSWVAGAVITGLFTLGGFMSLGWAIKITSQNHTNWLTDAINNTWLGYMPYVFPVFFFLFALFFAWRSFDTYLAQTS